MPPSPSHRRRRLLPWPAPVTWALVVMVLGVGVALDGCAKVRGVYAYNRLGSSLFTPVPGTDGRLEVVGKTPILYLRGTPAEMGTQYGRVMRHSLDHLDACLQGFMPAQQRRQYIAYARAHEAAIPADLRTEIQAMAQASEVPYEDLLALNVVPRLMCSALAAWGPATVDGRMLIGRNADYMSGPLADRGSLVIVRHPAVGRPTATVTFLGMVGSFTGVNDAGVVYANLLVFNAQHPGDGSTGVCIQLLLRQAAEQAGDADALASYLEHQQHVIPINAIIADPQHALVLECDPTTTRCRTAGTASYLAVTNYFRTALASQAVACPRYACLERAGQGGALDVPGMERALFAARMEGINIQAAVFDPAHHQLYVSINRQPAAAGPWQALDLAALFAAAP